MLSLFLHMVKKRPMANNDLIVRLGSFLEESKKADSTQGGSKSKAGDVSIEGDIELSVTLSMKEMSKLLRKKPLVLKIGDARGKPFTYRLHLKYGGQGVAEG